MHKMMLKSIIKHIAKIIVLNQEHSDICVFFILGFRFKKDYAEFIDFNEIFIFLAYSQVESDPKLHTFTFLLYSTRSHNLKTLSSYVHVM